ncbi:MAG TPA: hypothetical protein VFC67_20915 [Prolixibacteraceae bacterium]|nr:hypothetical protein [Prolixibacteraceae bacterium]
MEQSEQRGTPFAQYYNSALLSIIVLLAGLIYATVSKTSESIAVIQTEQRIDIGNMDKMTTRVIALERDNNKEIKEWVEKYFARKQQEINE